MKAIVYWKDDPAGCNIADKIRNNKSEFGEGGVVGGMPTWRNGDGKGENCGDIVIVEVPNEIVRADYLEKFFSPEVFVFASKHRSAAGKPCLTVHHCGNWGEETKVGGNPRELSETAPFFAKKALAHLANNRVDGFEVAMECTHHGPTNYKTPMFFAEVGSSEREWGNEKAGEAVAEAIIASISETKNNENWVSAIGFGGGHYCPSFSKLEIESQLAFGHICPNYTINSLDEKMFEQAKNKSKAKLAVLDWKGLKSEERKKVVDLASSFGVEVKKDKEFRRAD
ncbi:MAG: hypothetical protein NT157_04655 [Candidatus Micrarchaeota archaeon]|nr:hypothetical protein [Candidatus Micrarchaeota archaeon]